MQPIPLTRTAPHASPELLSFRDRQMLGLLKCVGLERPPPKQEQWNCMQLLYTVIITVIKL